MNKKIEGIFPALVTPLNPDRTTINVGALRKLITYHKSLGADGFYVAGATGEGLLLSVEARKKLIDSAIEEIGKEKLKVVHITDMNFENTKRLAKYAEDAGADVISAIPPIYFDYDDEDIYNYYKEIAKQVKIPLMLYHTAMADTNIDTSLFLKLFEIENITSVKWTVKDYGELINLIAAKDGIRVMNGPDDMLLCGLSAGCSGGIGTTYNILLPLYKRIYELYLGGKIQDALPVQQNANKIIAALHKYECIPATKAVLEMMGFEVGDSTFPMKAYSKEMKKQIFNDVLAAGLEKII